MKLAIMQPYFFPYIGYFQLMAAVDRFVVYDNIKYTKRGWINRNRILRNGASATIVVPLQHDSDQLDVRDRRLAAGFDRGRLLGQIRGAYCHAPYFDEVFPLIEQAVRYEASNLFDYLFHGLTLVHGHLGMRARLDVSSAVQIDHSLRSQQKVIAMCRVASASVYLNPAGGRDLYAAEDFAAHGIELRFLVKRPFEYPQFGGPFVDSLSIIDVLMFNPRSRVREFCLAFDELF